MSSSHKSNRLIHETSPYLLQHAYNPVEWYPWGDEALTRAREEDKPIIVSIGYSACHWCHVMERECFENEHLATIMNQHYINIKIDREERPDIDQIYMEAVQAMGAQGGWPLNVILTPDGKPFYGGTYFPPANWERVLNGIADAFEHQREEVEKSAKSFVGSVNRSDSEKYNLQIERNEYHLEELDNAFARMATQFDTQNGGFNRAPKFPMPSIWQLLLRYYYLSGNQAALHQAVLTLDKMALGGIYDQVGGGFARYSTDTLWFAPHFEKMLYDNGQLLSLYSEAYTLTQSTLYKNVIDQTIEFCQRELLHPEGYFFAALDADSEGIEGKFYCWNSQELNEILGENASLLKEFYQVRNEGNWEHDFNILHCAYSDEKFCELKSIDLEEFKKLKNNSIQLLLEARSHKIRPGLDDKCLCGWNGLMISGLAKAGVALQNEQYIHLAQNTAHFIWEKMRHESQLWRTYKNNKASIDGFLEDYATVIEGFIHLYQADFETIWLERAKVLTDEVLNNFYDEEEKLFFYTSSRAEKLIARKKEIFDNVIPASNSIMAHNLFELGHLLSNQPYIEMAKVMINKFNKVVNVDLQYSSNWGSLYAKQIFDKTEIVIIGPDYFDFARAFQKMYLPNIMIIASEKENQLELMQNRTSIDGKTTIYICVNKSCQLPVFSVEEALKLL